jgi:tetratricopeptide (TPR) repeat protein
VDTRKKTSLLLHTILPIVVGLLAIIGLGVFAFINVGGEDFHFYWDAVIVALLCGVLGGAAVWIVHGVLHSDKPSTTAQVAHEVGMAFIVSCVTILAIEITLHVHHSRELMGANDSFTEAIDNANREHTRAIDKANREHIAAIREENKLHNEAIGKQVEISRALRVLLDDFSNPPRTVDDAKIGLDAMAELEKKLPHRQLPRWKTMQLDAYGQLLFKHGRYRDAEETFKNALAIDQELADGYPNDLSFQRNLVTTFGRLAEVKQAQNNTADAIAWQTKAVRHVTDLLNKFPEAEEVRKDALRERRALGKLRYQEIKVGDTTEVVLDEAERAYYKVKLAAGSKYRIDLLEKDKGLDPYLNLLDAKWNLVAADDDGGGFPNARIDFTPRAEGNYWIEASTAPVTTDGYRKKQGKLTLKVQVADR